MKAIKKLLMSVAAAALFGGSAMAQTQLPQTYCNPLNVDYTYMIYNSQKDISYRSGADPSAVEFRGEYYMFVTRSMGYWHSTDLVNWDFITPKNWYFQGSNAPTAFNYKDSVLYVAGNPSGSMSILHTDNPKAGEWTPSRSIIHNLQDPELFIDDDGQAYMYWGSSNKLPIRARKMNRTKRFTYQNKVYEMINLDESLHGWERFGENNYHPTLKEGYIEGASMTKHNGKYYLQYGAPGTEFNVYADGVYIGDTPLGPWKYMKSNPMCLKPGGFINGSGHGSTMKDVHGQYWHFASMALASNSHWERRLCMFPTYFDKEGLMHADTQFGDYPRFGSNHPTKPGQFAGWMLLSYNKPAKVASSWMEVNKSTAADGEYLVDTLKVTKNAKGELLAPVLTDENSKSYWVAKANDDQQFVEIDLQKPGKIYALQINFHDHESGLYGRYKDMRHQYVVEASMDGKTWKTIVDKRNNYKDVPNDYVQLPAPVRARFVRYKNIHVPTPNLAMSEFRIFGKGEGAKPASVKHFKVERQKDRRDAMLTWAKVKGAQGYNIRWGIAPDKLYESWLVYDKTSLKLPSLDRDTKYYVAIESFNENGISKLSKPVMVK
ncbi:family 43 glycosylhydrolase [Persicobacter psychrovividus]|uniref:Endo-1,4-beta-xylanase n=1 Tax=Persicobacter psychrovividus TaxID=387638 RepID=A0ABN6LCB5_9BACT|nr:endo-1,4-beta-xylanase [Persicobacter psychrovividus]